MARKKRDKRSRTQGQGQSGRGPSSTGGSGKVAWGAPRLEMDGLPTIVGPDPLFPSPTEAIMADVSALIHGREFKDIDDANAFIREVTTAGPLPSAFPATPLARAQQLIYRAMDTDGKETVALARKALAISTDCADAYILLATETARGRDEELDLFRKALVAAERALDGTGYEEHLPHLWGHVPARPLLRSLFGLALAEWSRGARLAAVGHLRRILTLTEEDTQGVRYHLLGWLLDIDDRVLARELLGGFRETTSVWLWGDALLTFKEKGPAAARAKLRKAFRDNPLVPEFLLGEDDEEPGPDDRLAIDAQHAADHLGRAWIRDISAMWWLEDEIEPLREAAGRADHAGVRGRQPSDDPSGLEGDSLLRLIQHPVGTPGCAVVLRDDLTLPELTESAFLFNARLFLAKAASEDLRATAKGNLNTAFVAYMVTEMHLSEVERHWFTYGRPKREDDFTSLHTLRSVLTLAGLVEQKPRAFAVTDEGSRLLSDDAAGELQALLFRTCFGPFDLSFLDRMDEDFLLQATLPYTLFMMSREAGDWLSPKELRDRVLLDEARDPIAEESTFDESLWRFEFRLIEPLVAFGLLERRAHPDPPDDQSRFRSAPYRYYQVRRTTLFDRFVEFDIG